MSRRVVITGIGVISPLGITAAEVATALTEERSGIQPLQGVPPTYLPLKVGGEARTFTEEIDQFGPLEKDLKRSVKKGLKVMCRDIAMGVASAQWALHDAGLNAQTIEAERTGVVFGCDYIMTRPEEFISGVQHCLDAEHHFDFSKWAESGLKQVDPLWLLKYLPNMPASHIAIYNDLRGPSNSITVREASSNLSIAEGYCTIQRGAADTLVAGATGTRVHPTRTVQMALQEQLADSEFPPEKSSRPFDRDRRGLVLGEGAGAIILEELEHAQKRGAKIYGEIIGYGSSTVMNRQGVAQLGEALGNAMRLSLASAKMDPKDIGHIHAHGLGTRRCDAEEAQAIRRIFGDAADRVPVTAAKSYFGNLGAGSGTVELIASLLAMQSGQLFPLLNYEHADPECPIFAARRGMPAGKSVLSTNTTPQGQAAAVVARLFE